MWYEWENGVFIADHLTGVDLWLHSNRRRCGIQYFALTVLAVLYFCYVKKQHTSYDQIFELHFNGY